VVRRGGGVERVPLPQPPGSAPGEGCVMFNIAWVYRSTAVSTQGLNRLLVSLPRPAKLPFHGASMVRALGGFYSGPQRDLETGAGSAG
jgi:hypothetical protein